MITRSIEEVKLSSAIADELLPSITGDGFRGDNSWLATMRALLPSRLPDGAKVQLKLLVKETPSKKSPRRRGWSITWTAWTQNRPIPSPWWMSSPPQRTWPRW